MCGHSVWTLTGGSLTRTRALASEVGLGQGWLCPHGRLSSGQPLAPPFPHLVKQDRGVCLTAGFSVRQLGHLGDSWPCLQTFLVVVTRGAGIWRVEAREAAKTLQCTRQSLPQRITGPNGRGPRVSCPPHRHRRGEPFIDQKLRLLL